NGGNEQTKENVESKELSEGHATGKNLVAAKLHDERTNDAHEPGSGEAHQRCGGESLQDVIEEALNTGAKDFFFSLFRVIALHDANAAERFGEAAGDFGIDFGTRAKNRADGLESFVDANAEDEKDAEGESGHGDAGVNQVGEGERGGHQAADEFD